MSIQHATLNDIYDIADIDTICFPAKCEQYSNATIRDFLNLGRSFVYIANNKIVGYICGIDNWTSRDGAIKQFQDKFKIKYPFMVASFAVLPEYQNRKIGTKLLQKYLQSNVLNFYKSSYTILTAGQNNKQAQKLYLKHGFEYSGFSENSVYSDPADDAIVMFRKNRIADLFI